MKFYMVNSVYLHYNFGGHYQKIMVKLTVNGRMVELADALGSEPSVRKDMGVQVPLRPPVNFTEFGGKLKKADCLKHAIGACFKWDLKGRT